MKNLDHITTFSQLVKEYPNTIRMCCSIGFEYFKIDDIHFCKVAYYYKNSDITYDPRDDKDTGVDYTKFKVLCVYTDDHELE